jgi:hypothetical protein
MNLCAMPAERPMAMPWMFGYSARRLGVNRSAIVCTTVAEQFTVERMPT